VTLFASISASNQLTFSWDGEGALLLSRSLDCPVWVRVGGTSPATLSVTSPNPFTRGISGAHQTLPTGTELWADLENNLNVARDSNADLATRLQASKTCGADYFLLAPVFSLTPNDWVEEALSIGIDIDPYPLSQGWKARLMRNQSQVRRRAPFSDHSTDLTLARRLRLRWRYACARYGVPS